MTKKRINQLSSGQQRYLQLLLLLNLDHSFILLDEPFSMIEPLYKDLIKEKLEEYRGNKGFIVTDHYYRDVLDISDKTHLLRDGILIPIEKNTDLVDWGIYRCRLYWIRLLQQIRSSRLRPFNRLFKAPFFNFGGIAA